VQTTEGQDNCAAQWSCLHRQVE